jgi:hypothetical protein
MPCDYTRLQLKNQVIFLPDFFNHVLTDLLNFTILDLIRKAPAFRIVIRFRLKPSGSECRKALFLEALPKYYISQNLRLVTQHIKN